MALNNLLGREFTRVRFVLLVMIAAFVFLTVVLWRIQILRTGEYSRSGYQQSMRRVRLPGSRGRIFDRNNVCMADNRPSYCVAIYIEELRQAGKWKNTVDKVEEVVNHLAGILGIERQVTREDINIHIIKRLSMPFLAWRDVDKTVLARWAESTIEYSGVDLYVEPFRFYPMGSSVAHVLGYVGRADPVHDPEEPYHFYLPEMEGKRGVEAVMDTALSGIAGGLLVRVDAIGYRAKQFKQEKVGKRDPLPGEDITLTIDMRIQRMVEQILIDKIGAVVVLDSANGDVQAMASSPSFDPNSFSPSVSDAEWNRLNTDENSPLINRVISGIYPPGSTFKLLIAITALESGRATEAMSFSCPGYFKLGKTTFRCWRKSGHGRLAMQKALEQSCNAYFCQLGLRCEHKRIFHMADSVGFGYRTGIELGAEKSGLVPDDSWKKREYNDAWRLGDTCNVSIGQGALTVTPIQMAMFTAAIANGGYVYRPRLIACRGVVKPGNWTRQEGDLINKMAWSARTLKLVREGMRDVVQSDAGTGKRARISKVQMAGKTGTAEYGPRSDRKNYAWMILYAPFDRPRYAAALVIEDGVAGGSTAAPLMKELMEGIFALKE